MSGGHFNYEQYQISQLAEDISYEIDKMGKEIPEDQQWHGKEWLEGHPEDRRHHQYSPEIVARFKEAVQVLKRATIYAERIDYLLSGDDGDESFIKRMNEDLKKLEQGDQ